MTIAFNFVFLLKATMPGGGLGATLAPVDVSALQTTIHQLQTKLLQSEGDTQRAKDQLQCLITLVKQLSMVYIYFQSMLCHLLL